MNFQVSGEVLRILPVVSGTTQKGYDFKKQTIVLRAFDKEQHIIALEVRGKRVDEYDYLKAGDQITALFEIESRSYQNKEGKECFSSNIEAYYIRDYVGNPSDEQLLNDQVAMVANSTQVRR